MPTRPTRHARRASFLFALLAALTVFPAIIGSPARAAGTVAVAASTATPNFPQGIAFHLEASAQGAEIAQVALLYHPMAAPTVQRIAIPTERGSHIALDYALDTQAYYLPPGIDVEYGWLLILSDGTETRTPPATFLYMDGREAWKQITSGPVTLWWDGDDVRIGQDAADTAARTIGRLSGTFNVPGDRPVRILLYTIQRDLLAGLPPNSATWLGSSSTPALESYPGDR